MGTPPVYSMSSRSIHPKRQIKFDGDGWISRVILDDFHQEWVVEEPGYLHIQETLQGTNDFVLTENDVPRDTQLFYIPKLPIRWPNSRISCLRFLVCTNVHLHRPPIVEKLGQSLPRSHWNDGYKIIEEWRNSSRIIRFQCEFEGKQIQNLCMAFKKQVKFTVLKKYPFAFCNIARKQRIFSCTKQHPDRHLDYAVSFCNIAKNSYRIKVWKLIL